MNLPLIPPHESANSIQNLVLVYGVHLTPDKVSQKEALVMKTSIFQGQVTPLEIRFFFKSNHIMHTTPSSLFYFLNI